MCMRLPLNEESLSLAGRYRGGWPIVVGLVALKWTDSFVVLGF